MNIIWAIYRTPNGLVILNDTLTKDKIGKYWYTVSKIIDNKYHLTSFESNNLCIIFDKIEVKASFSLLSPSPWKIRVQVYSLAENKPISNATVYINGEKATYKDGYYIASIDIKETIEPVNISISAGEIKRRESIIPIRNLDIYSEVIGGIFIIAMQY